MATCQAPQSMGFSRQEYWSGLLFPSPGDLPNPGIKTVSPVSPTLQDDSFLLSHQGNPWLKYSLSIISFMDNAFGVVFKKSCPHPRLSWFPLTLSSRSFTVLYFTIIYELLYKLIFVKEVRSVSGFIFYIWMFSCSSTIPWENYLSSIVLSLFLCQSYLLLFFIEIALN